MLPLVNTVRTRFRNEETASPTAGGAAAVLCVVEAAIKTKHES